MSELTPCWHCKAKPRIRSQILCEPCLEEATGLMCDIWDELTILSGSSAGDRTINLESISVSYTGAGEPISRPTRRLT